jgi:hypothetical protein
MRLWAGIVTVLGVLGSVIYQLVRHRRGVQRLPEISDEEFIARFGRSYSAPRDRVFEGRRQVSKVLRVPEQKLSPEYTYRQLLAQLGTLDFRMAWGELEEDVELAARQTPGATRSEPDTVGDLVAGLIQAEPGTPGLG